MNTVFAVALILALWSAGGTLAIVSRSKAGLLAALIFFALGSVVSYMTGGYPALGVGLLPSLGIIIPVLVMRYFTQRRRNLSRSIRD